MRSKLIVLMMIALSCILLIACGENEESKGVSARQEGRKDQDDKDSKDKDSDDNDQDTDKGTDTDSTGKDGNNRIDEENMTLVVSYGNNEERYSLEENLVFSVSGFAGDYDFCVRKIEDGEVTIEASKYGLVEPNDNGSINLRAKEDKFVFNVEDGLELHAQIMDASFVIYLTVE